jgi:hypothetical protein
MQLDEPYDFIRARKLAVISTTSTDSVILNLPSAAAPYLRNGVENNGRQCQCAALRSPTQRVTQMIESRSAATQPQ